MFNWIKKLFKKDVTEKPHLCSEIDKVTEGEKLHSIEVELKQRFKEKYQLDVSTIYVDKNKNLITLFIPNDFGLVYNLNRTSEILQEISLSSNDIFIIYNCEYKPEYEYESKIIDKKLRTISGDFACVNVTVDEIYFQYKNCYENKIKDFISDLTQQLNLKYEIKPQIITDTNYFTHNYLALTDKLSMLLKEFKDTDMFELDWYYSFFNEWVVFEVKSKGLKHPYTAITQFNATDDIIEWVVSNEDMNEDFTTTISDCTEVIAFLQLYHGFHKS